MTATDATFVVCESGLWPFCHFSCRIPGDTARCPKLHRAMGAGNNLRRAQEIFASAVKHRPRIWLTIRKRTPVLQEWPAQ
jgi:hypothetical protein